MDTKKEKQTISWSEREYKHREKSSDWFWGVGIIAVVIIAAAVFSANYLLALLVALGAFNVALFGSRHPQIFEFELNQKGVRVNNKLYRYANLKSFWVRE